METHGARLTSANRCDKVDEVTGPSKKPKSRLAGARGYDNHTIMTNRMKMVKITKTVSYCSY